jgi:endo-1,4-beta-xylanase
LKPRCESKKNRQADAVVVVIDRAGKPMPVADVAIEQTRHAFLYGSNIFLWGKTGDEKVEAAYRRRFAELVSYATLPFFWSTYEPKRGQTDEERLKK